MRWFKHLTGAHQDEKMARLVSELGLEGYGFYWLILETIAGQIEAGSNRTALTYPVAFWRKITGFSPKKLRNFAEICSKIGIFSAEFSENSLTIDIPNILKYRDEWSRKKGKNSGVAPEPLRTKDTDTETETEEDKTPPTPPLGGGDGLGAVDSLPPEEPDAPEPPRHVPDIELEQFLDAYPERARQPIYAVLPAWLAMKKARAYPGLPRLFDALSEWEGSEQWAKEGGRFIPSPQKFLSGRFWLNKPPRSPDPYANLRGKSFHEINAADYEARLAREAEQTEVRA